MSLTNNQAIKTMDTSIFIVVMGIFVTVGNAFLCCLVGTWTKDNFWRYADISYESLWYKFPIDLQPYLRLIIADAQRPCIFNGFGIIELNVTMFGKVFSV